MTAVYLVIVETPWWMAVILYLACAIPLAIAVGHLLRAQQPPIDRCLEAGHHVFRVAYPDGNVVQLWCETCEREQAR